MLAAGVVELQLKLMVGSTRVSVGAVLNPGVTKAELLVFAQYWPSNPVPSPMAELLMKLALVVPLGTSPATKAAAVTDNEFVNSNGPVYGIELVVGTLPSKV